jgi:hypothetical protein
MLGNSLQGLTGDLADPHGRFDMDAGRICIVSAAALLAFAATATAGPMSGASAKLVAPRQTQTELAAHVYRHHFGHYGGSHRHDYHHRYGWCHHRSSCGWVPAEEFGALPLPFMPTEIWPYYGYPYDPNNGYYGPDYYL